MTRYKSYICFFEICRLLKEKLTGHLELNCQTLAFKIENGVGTFLAT